MNANGFTLRSPEGELLEVNEILFNVVRAFIKSPDKPSGSALIYFRSAVIVDAEATFKGYRNGSKK